MVAPTHPASPTFDDLESYRAELVGYCYRMLGASSEAEDAVQETLTKAWRNLDRFEGRSSVRTWLYRIASNTCFDLSGAVQRRARPMDLSEPWTLDGSFGEILPEATWVQPLPGGRARPQGGDDPSVVVEDREGLRLAFISALQFLPPKQRAVLILREVLQWPAVEVADLLDTTTASVNSALQRARATLDARADAAGAPSPVREASIDEDLLRRFVDAFQRYDFDLLAQLLHEDAVQSMPPYEIWLRGRDDVFAWWQGPGAGCRGSTLVPTVANGCPAFGQYKPSGPGGKLEPWALMVVEVCDDRIAEITSFLDTETLFPLFGLALDFDDLDEAKVVR
ncbi:MAG: sigma-70 family RNA polymerase sigma factor [Acidimicrobiales bacterium]